MRIALLGPLEVRTDAGRPVQVGGPRLRTLLILLALEAGRVATTQWLIDGVWGEAPPVGAANALQALVSRLRRAVPELPVESHPAGYRLAIPPDQVDVARFERLVGAGRAALRRDPATAADLLREALGLWRGPALADVADADFARAPAARLTELRLGAVEDRIEAELRLGAAGADVLAELEELVAQHPLRERLAALQVRARYAAGRPADALAAYERARAALADQLGMDPSPELAALHVAILRGDSGLLTAGPTEPAEQAERAERAEPVEPAPAAPAASSGNGAPRTNLRSALTSFVGREEDVARVGEMVGESRLTTLIGPGGAGKTRLAVESARTRLRHMPDGVWLVELAPVTDGSELPWSVLAALGLREQAVLSGRARPRGAAELTEQRAVGPKGWAVAESLDRLVGALADKRLLLVLDNCEHLVEMAAATVDRLLGACPGVRVLATSREPLRITGESLWPVGPLPMPPEDASPAEALRYPAVRLFADRAAAVRPGFAVDDTTVRPVVRICRALDGMPLAIELAAARLRSMTAQQVATRLNDRFRLLTGGSRTALPRHQTLRAVVDWSWELLDEAERALLRRLAVFTGGATVEAAEQVCAGGAVAPADVFDLLTALADKSLLVAGGEARGPGEPSPRFRMLETIRAYGLERLAEAGEADQIRAAHAAYFLALAGRAEPHLRRAEQVYWLARLSEEHDNLHAALRAAIAAGDALTANEMVCALGFYWWLSGRRAEACEFAAEVLAMPAEGTPARVRAATYLLGALNGIEANRDPDTLREWMANAVRLLSQAPPAQQPDAHPFLRALEPFSVLIETNGDQRALSALGKLFDDPDQWNRGIGYMMHAHVLLNSGREHERAEADFRRALAEFRALGERWGISFALTALSELSSWRGDHQQSAAMLQEAIARIRELGTREDLPQLQIRYAHELWLLGERERAEAMVVEAERIADQVGLPELIGNVAHARAGMARQEGEQALRNGDQVRARELFDAAGQRLARATTVLSGLASTAPQFHALVASELGCLAGATGDIEAARAHHGTALARAVHSRDAPVTATITVGIADFALRTQDAAGAAFLLGAAEAIRGMPCRDQADALRVERQARAALGDSAFAESHQRGQAATLDTITELVAPILGQDAVARPSA